MRVDLDHVGHRYADGPLLFHDLTAMCFVKLL